MILSNQVRCNKCGDEPFSAHRHDFKSCECGAVSVDGGMDYLRRVGDFADATDMSIEIPDEAGRAAIAAANQGLEDAVTPGSLSVLVITALGEHGVSYAWPVDDENEARDKVFRAVDEASAWAITNGRNGLGVLCAIARYVRDAGGSWVVPVDA